MPDYVSALVKRAYTNQKIRTQKMNKTNVFYTLQWLALVACMFLASPWLAVAFAGPFAAIAYIMAWDLNRQDAKREAREYLATLDAETQRALGVK